MTQKDSKELSSIIILGSILGLLLSAALVVGISAFVNYAISSTPPNVTPTIQHWGTVLEVKQSESNCAIRLNDAVQHDSTQWFESVDYRDSDFCSLKIGDEVRLMGYIREYSNQ